MKIDYSQLSRAEWELLIDDLREQDRGSWLAVAACAGIIFCFGVLVGLSIGVP